MNQNITKNKYTLAWLLLVSALALHVADEAIHDFLPFYNNLVESLRARYDSFPMPTFTLTAWLGGLIAIVIILFAITPIVHRSSFAIRVFTTAFAFLMIANATAHILGSIYYGYLLPGFWSSPVLLVASVNLAIRSISAPSRPAPA